MQLDDTLTLQNYGVPCSTINAVPQQNHIMLTANEALARLQRITFKIRIERNLDGIWEWGTGFFISPTGYALTVFHNLPTEVLRANGGRVDAFYKGTLITLECLVSHSAPEEYGDIAVLKCVESCSEIDHLPVAWLEPGLTVADRRSYWAGRPVCAFGFPFELGGQGERFVDGNIDIGQAVVEVDRKDVNGRDILGAVEWLRFVSERARGLEGISGAPILDRETGQIVAVEHRYVPDLGVVYGSEIGKLLRWWPELAHHGGPVGPTVTNRSRLAVLEDQPADAALRPAEPAVGLPDRPYPLLEPYTDPRTFAGRAGELAKLVSLVQEPQLILCAYAPSGAGKSSLLLAGLVPHLRNAKYPVALDRRPGDAGLATRLVKDLFALPDTFELPDDRPDLFRTFAGWMTRAYRLAGKASVIVLDQIEEVLRQPTIRDEALARLGPLIAATALRVPGQQGFPCRWVLCYRHEFHGEVEEWLQDALVHARRAKRTDLDGLRFDLTAPDCYHRRAVSLMGSASPNEDEGSAARKAFLDAINRPLVLQRQDGRPQYPVRFDEQGAERLAHAFARARVRQPAAPLLPELQVVLGHLLDHATRSANGESLVHVPEEEPSLDEQISQALAAHVTRALSEAFPLGRDASAGRAGRSRALLALRELVDHHGLRGLGRTRDELVQAVGPGGDEVIEKLASPAMRLIVREERGHAWVYVLTHDRLAEVVKAFVDSETTSGNLVLDRRMVELRRLIAQKSELYLRLQDESALTLTREDHDLIAAATPAFFLDDNQLQWWYASREWFAVTSALSHDPRAGFRALVQFTENTGVDWARVERRLRSANVDPKVFWDGPWGEGNDVDLGDDVFRIVSRTYGAFLDSSEHIRAMSFAVEEVVRRWPVHADRMRELRDRLRDAFFRRCGEQGLPALFRGDAWFLPDEGIDRDAQSPMNTVGLGFVMIPEGWFSMGSDPLEDLHVSKDEVWPVDGARRTLRLPTFAIGRYPVTVAQFRVFADATGVENAEALAGVPDHPVVYVSWYEALAYCEWLESELRISPKTSATLRGFLDAGAHIILPSEAEWEKAARGTDGRIYPWNSVSIDPSRANYIGSRIGHTTPVGAYPSGASPYGILDLSGNVWEWTRSLWGRDRDKPSFLYPYEPHDGREDLKADRQVARVVRGGAFSRYPYYARAAFRHRGDPHNRHVNFGFRVAVSPSAGQRQSVQSEGPP